jgi:hypothetical protein
MLEPMLAVWCVLIKAEEGSRTAVGLLLKAGIQATAWLAGPSDPLSYQHCLCFALHSYTGALLKEAIEDLEWPGSAVAVRLTQDPPAISLTAHGTGSLEVGSKARTHVSHLPNTHTA